MSDVRDNIPSSHGLLCLEDLLMERQMKLFYSLSPLNKSLIDILSFRSNESTLGRRPFLSKYSSRWKRSASWIEMIIQELDIR